jgi:hypothetical protein
MATRLRDDLVALARYHGGPCLSISLLTGAAPVEAQAAQLKHLLAIGAQQLITAGYRQDEVDALLAPGWDLVADRVFWGHPHQGLAIVAAPDLFRSYRLPYGVATLAVPGRQFHLKPLFPLLQCDEPFHVLALSKNHVRLLRGTWDTVEALALPGAPASLADTLQYDDFAPQSQLYAGVPGHGGARGGVFYGHGAASDTAKEELLRYCQQIDRALRDVLRGQHTPLVLAGVSYLLAIYRAATSYPAVLEDAIIGSPDHLSDEALRAQAWALLAPTHGRQRERAADHYRALAVTNPRRVTSHLRTVILAAASGRVETLFVAGDRQQWGTYDPASGALALRAAARAGDEDLLDTAAVHTFLHGGAVYVAPADQAPGGGPCAAVLRASSAG